MGWFDKWLGAEPGSSYRYDQGFEYPRPEYMPRQSSGGWHGPNIFDVSIFCSGCLLCISSVFSCLGTL